MITTERVKRFLSRFKFEVRRVPVDIGRDPYRDIRRWSNEHEPIIFDVGANLGQTIKIMREQFPKSVIHSFEPSQNTFSDLKKATGDLQNLYLNNLALGPAKTTLDFYEHSASDMSSMYQPGSQNWAKVKSKVQVPVETIDNYCRDHKIEKIDILKTDTQGFDLEVLKGAQNMLDANKVHLVFMEVIFSELYQGLPRFDEIYSFMADNRFTLVAFYQFYYRENRVGWTDALFVNQNFKT